MAVPDRGRLSLAGTTGSELLDEIAGTSHRHGGRCGVAVILDALDPGDADALRVALTDRDKYSGEAIAAALRRRGHRIRGEVVRVHRRGGCSCE
jgi:hypothetical protein